MGKEKNYEYITINMCLLVKWFKHVLELAICFGNDTYLSTKKA